jgi:hypothetical protein
LGNQTDETLEILTNKPDLAVMNPFYMEDGVTAKDITHKKCN